MAIRATPNDVIALLGDNFDEDLSLTPFIATANALVDWLSSKDAESELTATLLDLIEQHLAAHFYTHADKVYSARSEGQASGTFQGQTGMVLSSSDYGQNAMLLDVTGNLADRSKQAETGNVVAGFEWLGQDENRSSTEVG